MRRVILPIAALAALLAGYFLFTHFLWKRSTPSARVIAEPTPDAQLHASPSTQPIVLTPTHPAATPDTRRLAPEGVYYLLGRISVTTDSGVVGVNAGTQVLLLEKQENGALKVTDGPDDFVVAASEITNDLDIAARLTSGKGVAAQRALRPTQPARNAEPHAGAAPDESAAEPR